MTCCRHLVDDHTPAGCVWCTCRVTREEHADRPEVDGLEDWRRAGGPLAEWTLSAAWLTAPADASRPGPVSGVIDRARAKPAVSLVNDRMRRAAAAPEMSP